MEVHKKGQKTRFTCNFNGKSSFSLTQRASTRRSVITLGSIFTKMVFKNRAQGSKVKGQEVSAKFQKIYKKLREMMMMIIIIVVVVVVMLLMLLQNVILHVKTMDNV